VEKPNQKNFVFGYQLIVTIVFAVGLILMWTGVGKLSYPPGMSHIEAEIIFTFVGLIIIALSWILFRHQEKVDEEKQLNMKISSKKDG
jgi:Co/Zn/Cd efflux system component